MRLIIITTLCATSRVLGVDQLVDVYDGFIPASSAVLYSISSAFVRSFSKRAWLLLYSSSHSVAWPSFPFSSFVLRQDCTCTILAPVLYFPVPFPIFSLHHSLYSRFLHANSQSTNTSSRDENITNTTNQPTNRNSTMHWHAFRLHRFTVNCGNVSHTLQDETKEE